MTNWKRKLKHNKEAKIEKEHHKIIDAQDNYAEVIQQMCVLFEQEKYNQTLELGAVALKSGCRRIELLLITAKCFYFTGDYKRAEEWFQNTLQFNPDNAEAKVFLGRLYLMQGDKQKAIDIWQLALQSEMEDSFELRKELSQLLEMLRENPLTKEEQEEEEAARKLHIEVWQLLDKKGPKEYLAEKNRLQAITIRRLKRKKQINIAFVLYDSSMWCGDNLYYHFANDKRYNTVVYLCKRHDAGSGDPATIREFYKQTKEMKERGINVVPIIDEVESVDYHRPDILVAMTPYDMSLPRKLVFAWMSFSTLLVYIPYSFFVWDSQDKGERSYAIPMTDMAWKMFIDTESNYQYYIEHKATKFVNGEASGCPRCDALYKANLDAGFTWKEAVPNSKRIIYAPHWSIDDGCKFSTFQHNYSFIYDFARKHKEISWVVKPHPNLVHQMVSSALFLNEEEALRYFERWDELPNAQVVTGGDYQKIFAGSDAMILDSGSFIGEYQYTGKPLLFLTRAEQSFMPLALKILQNNYYVDGRDWFGIVEFITRVIIQGKDVKYNKRKEFFKQELDYKGKNGLLASEYIYRSIDNELHPNEG